MPGYYSFTFKTRNKMLLNSVEEAVNKLCREHFYDVEAVSVKDEVPRDAWGNLPVTCPDCPK